MESFYFPSVSDERTSWQTQVGNLIIKEEFLGYSPLEGQGQTVLGTDSTGHSIGQMFAALYREFERRWRKEHKHSSMPVVSNCLMLQLFNTVSHILMTPIV